MLRRLIPGAAILLLLSNAAVADDDKSILPLYGSEPKTQEEKKLDEQFVQEVVKAGGTAQKAADHLIQRGWEAIDKHDADGAMRRFNQVSLLTPGDYRIYWGIGAALGLRKEFPATLEYFEKAEKIALNDPRLLCDHGFAFVGYGLTLRDNPDRAIENFIEADKLYRRAIRINPKLALAYSRLAVLMYYKGDFGQAEELVRKARALGGEGLDPAFEHDLSMAVSQAKARK